MADFFEDNKLTEALEGEKVTEIAPEPVAEKIKLGDKEYSQDELNRLVSLGNIATELEEKWHTKIDRVYPEYTQSQQKVKAYEDKAKKYDELLAQQAKTAIPEDQQVAEAKKLLREQFGVVTKDDLKELLGFGSKDEWEQNLRATIRQEKEADKLLDEASDLEKEIDGTDGRPKFDKMTVLTYMAENRVPNLMTAYKLMNETALDAWKEGQLGKVKKKDFVTQERATITPDRQPVPERLRTEDDLFKALTEQFNAPEL